MFGLASIPPIVGVVVLPLAAALAAFVLGRRAGPMLALATTVGVGLLLARLSADVLSFGPSRHAVGGWGAPLGIDICVDGLSVVMLFMTTLVAGAVTIYSWAYFGHSTAASPGDDTHHQPAQSAAAFWPLLLFGWGALNALFLSGDLFNLYVTLEMLTLASVAMITLAGRTVAIAAALRYLLVALAASLVYLLGLALLFTRYGTVDLVGLAEVVESGPVLHAGLTLMTVGLVVKSALFPMHFWLPAAHANAPAPVSAVLSALVIKGSFYIAMRLWIGLGDGLDFDLAGRLLAGLGAAAILYGSWQAFRQRRLKLLIAYSTVAQVGYLFIPFAVLGDPAAADLARNGAAYFALAHGCAKASLFMAAGCIMHALGTDEIDRLRGIAGRLPVVTFAFGLAGASIVGLPPSGGFIAKWLLLNASLNGGEAWLVGIMLIGGLLAAAYIFKVLGRALTGSVAAPLVRRVPPMMEWSALGLALAAVGLGVVATRAMELLESGAAFASAAGVSP